ncbi:Putative lipoprotein mlpA precursor [Minicystis rosea]|nr:Putative lipoprotein mlpA precursor [Minicystis rosea]
MKRALLAPLLALLAAALPSCGQPRINCTTGHGGFAARYTLKPGSKQGEGTCDTLKGEIIGLEKYNPARDDPNKQDLTHAILAIQSSALGNLANAAEAAGLTVDRSKVSSIGDFTSVTPDDEDVCSVPALAAAALDVPAIDMSPATSLRYEWSDVRVYVTTASPGTQMVATVKITQDGCSAQFDVLGLWPAVSCETLDAEGNGTGAPDPVRCDPNADPDAGRPTGSGINPDLKDAIVCDPDLLLCVLKEIPAALR